MKLVKFFMVAAIVLIFSIGCSNRKSSITDHDSGTNGDTGGNGYSDTDLPRDDGDVSDTDVPDDDPVTDDSNGGVDDGDVAADEDKHDTDDELIPDVDKEEPDDGLEPDGMGPGSENGYDPGSENADGISVDENGWLIIDDSTYILRYLYVSNSMDGTVSKIDTFTQSEVGRYAVGLGAGSDPSRTSVDLEGNVFVGNRADGTVTKIAGKIESCVDRNGNDSIETSTGGDNVLPRDGTGRSTDECVLWTRQFSANDLNPPHICSGIRAVAATPETGTNYEYTGHVWVGCATGQEYAYKLNGNTGDIMQVRKMTNDDDTKYCRPYGFVLDKFQRLWTSCRAIPQWQEPTNGGIAYIDTEDETTRIIYTPDNHNPYGIAIDGKNRIWVSGFNGSIYRYTPGGALLNEGTWDNLNISTQHHRGIAVDKYGFVWAITTNDPDEAKIFLVNGDTFPDPSSVIGSYGLANDEHTHVVNGTGVAVDFLGNIWGVSRNHGNTDTGFVTFMKVDRSGTVPVVLEESKKVIPVGKGPYVYSDMIGYNLKNFATREGWYRNIFEICKSNETTIWEKIYWEADLPEGTKIIIRARAADLIEALSDVDWMTIVEVPSDTSPKDIPDTLPNGHFIELEARLYSEEEGLTPKVGLIHFDYRCRLPY
jgi:hypothetical protein